VLLAHNNTRTPNKRGRESGCAANWAVACMFYGVCVGVAVALVVGMELALPGVGYSTHSLFILFSISN